MSPSNLYHLSLAVFLFSLTVPLALEAKSTVKQYPTQLSICSDPQNPRPCLQAKGRSFAPYELPFALPASLKRNLEYRSVPFYGVILKSHIEIPQEMECDQDEYNSVVEKERQQAQALFPERKVFGESQCPDMGALSYWIEGQSSFDDRVMVYGGVTLKEAIEVLEKAKAKYPQAVIKKMQVSHGPWEEE